MHDEHEPRTATATRATDPEGIRLRAARPYRGPLPQQPPRRSRDPRPTFHDLMSGMTFDEFDARREELLARGERINASRGDMMLSDDIKGTIAKMVDEVQDRLDDLVPEAFPELKAADPDNPEIERRVDIAFGMIYEEFMKVMRNE